MYGILVHSTGVTFKQIGGNLSNDPKFKTKIQTQRSDVTGPTLIGPPSSFVTNSMKKQERFDQPYTFEHMRLCVGAAPVYMQLHG